MPIFLENIHPEWFPILNNNRLNEIKRFLDTQDEIIYPSKPFIFRAFSYKPPSKIKVVILGQDCYHQQNQANGLCFAINKGCRIPPSLRNIKKELFNDLKVELIETDLIKWANQGVLLLNSSLTVIDSKPGSHLSIWKDYTDNIIRDLSDNYPNLVFILWGKKAQTKIKFINTRHNHYILTSNHPSPLSANRGGWFNNHHFSLTNNYLKQNNCKEIDW
jgi:uracil-DNA glycosylase